jgi:hypothetical protein
MALPPETVAAARKAQAAPCAICGATDDITARQLVPHFPQFFGCPDGKALLIPLCAEHLYLDKADLEGHLLACRIMVAADMFGWSFPADGMNSNDI